MSIVILNYSFDLLMLWFCAWCASVSASAWYIWITSNGKHTHTRVYTVLNRSRHMRYDMPERPDMLAFCCVYTQIAHKCVSVSLSRSRSLRVCRDVHESRRDLCTASPVIRYDLHHRCGGEGAEAPRAHNARRCACMHTPISVSVLRMSLRSQQSVLCTL